MSNTNQTVLIVDDNRDYAGWTAAVLEQAGYPTNHVLNAAEGIDAVTKYTGYLAVFSDITMEHPGAGLAMVPKLRKLGYRAPIVLVSTGFDYAIVFWLSRLTLRWIGVDGLVVKRKMKQHGKWEIKWISKRAGVDSLARRLAAITEIPGWKRH